MLNFWILLTPKPLLMLKKFISYILLLFGIVNNKNQRYLMQFVFMTLTAFMYHYCCIILP